MRASWAWCLKLKHLVVLPVKVSPWERTTIKIWAELWKCYVKLFYKKEIKLSSSQARIQEHIRFLPSFYCTTSDQSHVFPLCRFSAFWLLWAVSLPSIHSPRLKHLWEFSPGKGSRRASMGAMSYCLARDRINTCRQPQDNCLQHLSFHLEHIAV